MPWMPTPEQRAAISAAISAAQKRSWAERRAERIAAIAAGVAKKREADAGASGRATPDAADPDDGKPCDV